MSKKQLSIRAGQCSEKGVKEKNDDSCGIYLPEDNLLNTKGIAIVIADGVSSSEGGREASETCVCTFLNDYYSTPETWTVKKSGKTILTTLNHWLYSKGAKRYASDFGMLSTMSALVLKATTAHFFHVGDTRIYLLRDGYIECLTSDHIMRISSGKSVLNRAMGADEALHLDYKSIPVEEGDIFFFATDGVYEYFDNKFLVDFLQKQIEEPEHAARFLVKQAIEKGSTDNVTCQILQVTELPEDSGQGFQQEFTELPFPPFLEQGMTFEGYRILRELHANKRTQVYLAEEKGNGGKVIIKTPSVNYDDDQEFIDRFLQEEWIGKRIKSPYVLKVLNPIKEKRYLYYVTEYVEGQTLEQWAKDNPEPSLSTVRQIIEQIITGLRAFHRQEMLHQDLKLENIMIDENGTIKIIDFGSTRAAGLDEMSSSMTATTLLGTLGYAAPEYFHGLCGTEKSDLYSLGVITYQLLTGEYPYGEITSAKPGQHKNYAPVHFRNKEVPAWIDWTIKKAVSIEPEKRQEAFSEFLYDLKHPNSLFSAKNTAPLLERNPIGFWRSLAIMEFTIILLLLFLTLT